VEEPKEEKPVESNINANSTEVKPESAKPSFFKQHWGKIGAGIGALGALGYGAYKYNQNKNNNRWYSKV